MLAPAGLFHLLALFSATATLALLSSVTLAATESGDALTRTILAGLPRYDPSIREKDLATKATKAVSKNAPAPLLSPGDSPRQTSVSQQAGTVQPVSAAHGAPSAGALELPKITVHPNLEVPKPRPRLTVTQPVHNLKAEPLESQAGREARLVRKHLTKLDQALNSKKSNLTRAKAAEHVELQATQLNDLANVVDTATVAEQDPELTKKIRDEFEKLSNGGPK